MRVSVFALTVCLVALPGLGWADTDASSQAAPSSEVVTTAATGPDAPNQKADPQLTRWLQQAPPVAGLGQDRDDVIQNGPDRQMHGEVGVSVGTGGYRDGYAVVTMPVGKTGELGVAVEDEQYSKPWKSERRSLDVSLALGGARLAPDDCGSSIRVGDHYVEPLWATEIRGSSLRDVDPRCISASDRLR